jgi:hypothetical protein
VAPPFVKLAIYGVQSSGGRRRIGDQRSSHVFT